MRRLVSLAAIGCALLLPAANAQAEPVIAVFTKNNTNPAYEAFRLAADQIARNSGMRAVHYVPKKPDDVDEQKALIDVALKTKPDVVIFIPVDDVAMVEPAKKFNAANIPVVNAGNPFPGTFTTYVGADDEAIGYREARYLFEHMGGRGGIVIIEGTPKAPTNRDRLRGYQRALKEFPNIKVLGSERGNYQQPDARAAMEKLLKEHPQIDAVLSANDSMSLGVLEAMKAADRKAIVMSINGILPAVKKVESGEILGTVDFNMFKIGCMETRAAVRTLKREPLPEKVMLPADVIDKSNYKPWLVPVNQRTCPEWSEIVK